MSKTKSASRTSSTDIEKPLSDMQELFCREYVVDLNATQAAIRAGFSAKTSQTQSSAMMGDPRVQKRLAELSRERMTRLELNADTVLRGLLEIAMADIGEAYDENGNLKNIKEIPPNVRRAMSGVEVDQLFDGSGEQRFQSGVVTKVKFWDKPKSLELLGKHLKLFVEKHEHTFPEIADRVARARQRAVEESTKRQIELNDHTLDDE